MIWTILQTVTPQTDGVFSSIAIIVATIAVALSKGYLNKQFSGVHDRISRVEKGVSGLRVEITALDGRVKGIPADTALQIAESYEKGSSAARTTFVSKDSCGQRQKDVDRRMDKIEGTAGTAARLSDRADARISGLEHEYRGDGD